ncbi:MAG: cytochrome c oxidase subunit 3 [Acidobacteriaceae bacterium]
MPATFTNTPVDVERKEPGFGGRPPFDRRPTGGGGDGENWGDRPSGRRGPRELLARYRLALFFGLSGDLMFFIALVSAFFVRQTTGHFDAYNNYINDWHPILIPPILWLNTAVILLSSVTMEVARQHMFREVDVMDEWLGLGKPTAKRALPWLLVTAALGITFLVGQWVAWKQLALQGVFFASNPSSYFFYLITGSHGLHLMLGVIALMGALASLFVIRKMELRQIAVDCTAWYWHSMGVFWIFLFALLLFFQ